MADVEVIPVVDVMEGLVVHAIAGRREEYKPLENSIVARDPRPMSVLTGFKQLGFRKVYIADLDAITGSGNNAWVIELAVRMGFKVLADIGRRGIELRDSSFTSYVIGTEYLVYPGELELLRSRVISLDMRGGDVVFRNTRKGLASVLLSLKESEPRLILVIDLDRVGTQTGLNVEAIERVARAFPGKVLVGGGVRDERDIVKLKGIGVSGVLVATAIHKGLVRKNSY